jgi:glutathione S-transferase
MIYQLWYWPEVPGRGEFVRLALEAGRIAYRDCARMDGDMLGDLRAGRDHAPFAPPYLIAGRQVIGQTANILLFLGEAHGLAPRSISGRLWVNQVQLTIADAVAEAHDVHHPVDAGAYYEDQKPEATRRAAAFRTTRMPKYLDWFEQTLERQGEWLGGGRHWSYADLSLFQLIAGLSFAFPKRMARLARSHTLVMTLHQRVAALPELAGYLASDRRVGFGDGIFRHYPELDGA